LSRFHFYGLFLWVRINMNFFADLSYDEALSVLTPYLSVIVNEGFATRKRAKPVGRHIYRSYYDDVSFLRLIKGKSKLSLCMAFDDENNLQGIAIGSPMTHAFGHSLSNVTLSVIPSSAVQKTTTIQAYRKLSSAPLKPFEFRDETLYELVFVACSFKAKNVGKSLVDRLLSEAASRGYTLCLGEASASTHIGTLRLVQKVYLKWGFLLFCLEDSETKSPCKGPVGDYFVVGKSLCK